MRATTHLTPFVNRDVSYKMTERRVNQYRKCSLAKPCVWPRETAINKAPLCDSSSLSSALSPSIPLSLSLALSANTQLVVWC